MPTHDQPFLSNQQIADFLEQSQERSARRYHEEFRQEQMKIYKERLKKNAAKKDVNAEDAPNDEQETSYDR